MQYWLLCEIGELERNTNNRIFIGHVNYAEMSKQVKFRDIAPNKTIPTTAITCSNNSKSTWTWIRTEIGWRGQTAFKCNFCERKLLLNRISYKHRKCRNGRVLYVRALKS